MSGYSEFAPQGGAFNLANTSVFRPTIWSTDLIRYRRTNLVIAQHTLKSSFNGTKGDKIKMPRIGRLGVRPKQSGAPVYFQNRSESEWEMVIDRYMESSFSIEEIAEVQANQNLRSIYTEEAGRALAEDIDNFILAQRAAVLGAYPSDHITSTNPISYADILAAWEILNVRKVPKQGRKLFISPGQEASMLNIPQFTQNGVYNGGTIASMGSGTIGTILGMPVEMTTALGANSLTGYQNGDDGILLPTPGMTGSTYFPTQNAQDETGTERAPVGLPAGYTTAMIATPEWCRFAVQKVPRVDATWSTEYQEWRVVQTQVYGAKVYRADSAVLISTDEDNLVA
jgi:hypothetical protein